MFGRSTALSWFGSLAIAPVLAVGLLLLWGATSWADEPKDTTAVIASWNIKAKPDPIDSVRARQIARGILLLDAEVLALEEVRPPEIVGEIVAELKRLGATYSSAMPPQVSELQLALFYKPGVVVERVTTIDELNLGDDNIRKGLAADIRINQFDFHLVAVHLKSGGEMPEQQIRAKQVELLRNHLRAAMAGPEKDVILVGDYNMTPTRDATLFEALNPDQLLRVISNEDLAKLGSHIFEGRYGNLLDGFSVSKGFAEREYISGSLRIFPLNKALDMSLSEYDRQVSDHLPLTARFLVTQDDD